MSMFQCSALATRTRTTSLNIDSLAHARRLHDIIEEDNRYSSSVPSGGKRNRAHTIEGTTVPTRTRHSSMSDKEALDSLNTHHRRSSTGNYPRRTAPLPPHQVRDSPPLYPSLDQPDAPALATSPPRPGTFSICGVEPSAPPAGPGTPPRRGSPQTRRPRYNSTTLAGEGVGGETLNLLHVDFTSQDKEGDSKEDAETFLDLIGKANTWLEENPDVRVVTAETVTWSTPEKSRVFTDGAVGLKCTAAGKKTKNTHGLRVWYVASGDKFWLNVGPRQQLGVRDYLPGRDNGISVAVTQLNEDMRTKPITGKVLRVETLRAQQDSVTGACVTRETLDNTRKYFRFLRLIYVTVEGMPPVKAKLGLRDFIPRLDARSPHSAGYETFSELYGRAARWIFTQNKSRIINLQNIQVKIKKEDTQEKLQNMSLWETSAFTEHGDKKTDYLKIIRVVFLRQVGSGQENLTYKLSQKVFSPRPVTSSLVRSSSMTSSKPPEGATGDNNQDGGSSATSLTDKTLEDLQAVEGRVNSWLIRSGARLLSIETLCTPCRTLDDRLTSRDLSFHSNQRDKNVPQETWVTHFRLYLDGNYKNVPDEV